MQAAIIDLDGTLAEIGHRLHFVQGGRKNWNKFFAGIPDDTLAKPIAKLVASLHETGTKIVLCSGRPETCRKDTVDWLARFEVAYDALYMRAAKDMRPDHVVKAELLAQLRDDGYEPYIVVDDRQSVVDMWRENGLTCLQCAPDDSAIPRDATLTLLVGPTGAGKSTWLERQETPAAHIISSDQIREDMSGDFRDQTKNAKVFSAVHAMARARLKHGLPVVIDATHLRRKDRLAAVALAQGTGQVHYIVLNRPMEEKYRDAGWRAELDFDLIAKHEQTFSSQLKDILAGDKQPNVTVHDERRT